MKKKRIKLSSNASVNLSLYANTVQTNLKEEINRAQTAEGLLSDKITTIAAEKLSAKKIRWGSNSNINDYVTQGYYIINGERLNTSDGLPILNSNPGHTIAAILMVADSTINSNERCVTQLLTLSNRTGADGNVYIRTATGNTEGLSWSAWGRMATNIEVGEVNSLDEYTDNGIYSGIFHSYYSTETFVMIVINNYLAAGSINTTPSISQFKYALGLDGTVTFKKRVGGIGVLGSWTDINTTTSGYTDKRPDNPMCGYCFFDIELNKPIWWNGNNWVDATGNLEAD